MKINSKQLPLAPTASRTHLQNKTRPIQFPTAYVAGCVNQTSCGAGRMRINFADVTTYAVITRRQIRDKTARRPQGQIMWVYNVQGSNSALGPMLGAMVIQPELCGPDDDFLTTSACMVGARRASTTSYVQSRSDGIVMFSGMVQSHAAPDSLGILTQ